MIGPTFTSFRLPFGTVYAANLTPDPETGIGRVPPPDVPPEVLRDLGKKFDAMRGAH